MTTDILFGILLAGILSNNYALLHFLGTGAVVENRRGVGKSLQLGLGATLVLVITTLITWPLDHYVLAAVPFLQTMVFVIIVMVVVEMIHLVAENALKPFCQVDFVKFAINGMVLGLCVHNTALSFGEAVVTAFATGIGFMLTMILYGMLHRKLDEDSIPKAFRGLPIDLLLAGMMALALLALS